MKLSTCIIEFFNQYLPHIKGSSEHTIKSYRDTFAPFLLFAAQQRSIKVESLSLGHLSVDLILSFLNYLQSKRHNSAQTRNQRLAAIKSFAKMIRFMYPQERKIADIILSIPQRRSQKKIVGFLYPNEILKLFETIDLKK